MQINNKKEYKLWKRKKTKKQVKKVENEFKTEALPSSESRKKSVWEMAMDSNMEPIITEIVDMRAILR